MSGTTSPLPPTQRVMMLPADGPGLVRREQPRVHQLLNVGMVLGELEKLPVAEKIRSTVTHLPDEIAAPEQDQHGGRRPHSLLVVLRQGALETASLAARIAARIRSLASSSDIPRSEPMARDVIRTAISLATSRPQPSHSVRDDEDPRWECMRQLSSLPDLTIPTSVRAAQVKCTVPRRLQVRKPGRATASSRASRCGGLFRAARCCEPH